MSNFRAKTRDKLDKHLQMVARCTSLGNNLYFDEQAKLGIQLGLAANINDDINNNYNYNNQEEG